MQAHPCRAETSELQPLSSPRRGAGHDLPWYIPTQQMFSLLCMYFPALLRFGGGGEGGGWSKYLEMEF